MYAICDWGGPVCLSGNACRCKQLPIAASLVTKLSYDDLKWNQIHLTACKRAIDAEALLACHIGLCSGQQVSSHSVHAGSWRHTPRVQATVIEYRLLCGCSVKQLRKTETPRECMLPSAVEQFEGLPIGVGSWE